MATVKSSQVVNSRAKVQVYLVTNDKYLEPLKGIYLDPKTGKDFPNNDERFIFFQKSVLETCHKLGWRPDIIHCNDWQTALIPVFMKELYAHDNFFAHTKTVFTIHNMCYQGIFPPATFAKTGLPAELFVPGSLVFGGDTNGRFRAFNQDSGKVLWEVNLGAPVTGYPVSYAAGGKHAVIHLP